ncbi:MAG: hypothetical protein NT155_03010 [Candidatus Staskawiczbacteria bacterium]|nr:hypothetical protein [Candidatus Staskawiczbacteria bacterium]
MKLARANADATNIGKALMMFYSQYGEYPISQNGEGNVDAYFDMTTGDPWLKTATCTDSSNCPHLSKIYKSNYKTDYFASQTGYYVYLSDADGNGKIGCGEVYLNDYSGAGGGYGYKRILCQDCDCTLNDQPFRTVKY